MATHSSILAWKIPWTEAPGGLQSMGSRESDTGRARMPRIPLKSSSVFGWGFHNEQSNHLDNKNIILVKNSRVMLMETVSCWVGQGDSLVVSVLSVQPVCVYGWGREGGAGGGGLSVFGFQETTL